MTEKRVKDPCYDIYELRELYADPDDSGALASAYVLVAEAVKAPNRRAAIVAQKLYGSLVVLRHGEAIVITRKQAEVVVDEWS